MAIFKIGQYLLNDSDEGLQKVLSAAYVSRVRPLCMCKHEGVEMYIAKRDNVYLVKRWPNSGADHDGDCDSFEPSAELSGLGEVLGTAIDENTETGYTTIKFDFSLSKQSGRLAPVPGEGEADSVKTDGSKLGFRGTVHYLWELSKYNHWSPNMEGKRKWFSIRSNLLTAAADMGTKKQNLCDVLYIPEHFTLEKKDELAQRRMAKFMSVAKVEKGVKKLLMVLAEVKEIAESRYGHKIIFKHLPDCHFMMPNDLHKRLIKKFDSEISLWDSFEKSHLIAIGTFGVSVAGIPTIEEIALVVMTENWIPFENMFEKQLIDSMTGMNRKFVKGMRYNMASTKPLACLTAKDTIGRDTAMFILPPGSSDGFEDEMLTLMRECKSDKWIWRPAESVMPEFPPKKY